MRILLPDMHTGPHHHWILRHRRRSVLQILLHRTRNPFPVRECTFYEDKRLPSKRDMEEIAWTLRSTTTKPNQNLGFVSAAPFQEVEPKLPQRPRQLPAN